MVTFMIVYVGLLLYVEQRHAGGGRGLLERNGNLNFEVFQQEVIKVVLCHHMTAPKGAVSCPFYADELDLAAA